MLGTSWSPGWLVDPFDVDVVFDHDPPLLSDCGAGGEGEVFTDPWYAYNGSMHLFCGQDAVVSGTVTLKTSNQRKVHHLGVKVTIEEYIHFLDPYVPTRLKYVSDTICQEGLVDGESIYPFSIPLSTLNKAAAQAVLSSPSNHLGVYPNLTHWLNSYTGNSFAIRHLLTVEVCRPWYTFNLYRYKNLSFQLMDEANNKNSIQHPPRQGDTNNNNDNNTSEEENTAGSYSQARTVPETFHVDGLSNHGKCRVTLHSTYINLARSPLGYSRGGAAGDGAIIRGTFQLSDLEETIVSAKCMLIRAEYVGAKSSHDELECEHLLFGVEETDSVDILKDEEDRHLRMPRSRGYLSRQDVKDDVVDTPRVTDPVRKGTLIQFEICLDGSGRDNDMNATIPSSVNEGTDIAGITHHMRIQNALWHSLAFQLCPTFYYLPLDLSKEEPDSDIDGDDNRENLSSSLSSKSVQAAPHASVSPAPTVVSSASKDETNPQIGQPLTSSLLLLPPTSVPYSRSSEAEVYTVASDESVCLRYFLRVVVVEKSGKKLWETVELVFYYSPPKDESSLKSAFLSASRHSYRKQHERVTLVPPFLQTLENDELTEKNENV